MLRTTILGLALAALAGCAEMMPKSQSASKGADERFIPLELWSGAEWNGANTLEPVKMTTVTGKRKNRLISGPQSWSHPNTGESLLVYERVNHKKSGDKRQLFAIRDDGAGLGRVMDSRPDAKDRFFDGEALFPLGFWKRGEKRDFEYVEFTSGGPRKRVATIKIRRLDYTYKGVEHSLKFDWILRNEFGRVMFHESYIYSPGLSLVRYRDRLEEQATK